MEPNDPLPTAATDENAVAVLAEFAEAGWGENHVVRAGGDIECGRCGETAAADRWTAQAQHRIEGASDPDALQLVVGLECPNCEARGAIVIGYGPNGSDEDGEIVMNLDMADDLADPIASAS
ncbi:MAG: hypothetical protein WA964_16665 [Ilumatobacter sp.]|uniref:hypothetical protein n=1 Tax=Ilumatobacter sp. TaxID=1967498 RepID=UPI003C78C3DC